MKIEKSSERFNVLLGRKEVTFTIDHGSSGTPQVFEVRKALADSYKVGLGSVFIVKLDTLTGTNQTVGWANVYDSEEQAKRVTPTFIQLRNLSPEERDKLKEKAKQEKSGAGRAKA